MRSARLERAIRTKCCAGSARDHHRGRDYNLIECGDDVVIGGAVHLSGHTVEAGIVKTARVRLGNNVTVGLGSVIEIGVEIGSNSQVGALSFVPKHTKLKGGVVYAGTPAMPIE